MLSHYPKKTKFYGRAVGKEDEDKGHSPFNPPDELIVEILLKLPVRSVLRFKCVCKSWLSLISDPLFAKSHFDIAAAPSDRLLKLADDYEASSISIEAPLLDDSAEAVFNIPLPLYAPKYGYGSAVDIVGSCRGFILLQFDFTSFVLWNPSTGLQRRINYNLRLIYSQVCGIGYDSSADDYVVVIAALAHHCMGCFSLRTNSWSFIEGTVPYDYIGHELKQGEFLNGALHWLVESYGARRVIIAFDVKEKRLSEIPLPHDLAVGLEFEIYHLRVMGGCLSLCLVRHPLHGNDEETPVHEMWTMKEYKVHSSWTKSTFDLSASYDPFNCRVYPICFTENGDILGLDDGTALVRINDKGNLLECRTHGGQYRSRYGLLNCGMYRESLLSLPGDFEKQCEDEQH